MTLLPFLLVVAAAFIHATWNLLSKRAAPAGSSFVIAYSFISAAAYAPWALWLIASGGVPWSLPVLGCLALSGLIHSCYGLCLQRGYQVADLSVVYPVARGTGPLLSSFGAFLFLGEMASRQGLFGLFAVVVGIGLIASNGKLAAFTNAKALAGVRWGAATGLLIASYSVVDAYGVKQLGIPPVLMDWCSNIMRMALLLPMFLHNRERAFTRMTGYWKLAIGVGLLSPLSYIMVLFALDLNAPLSIVAPMREMSMMVGALFGMVILREPVGFWRLAGCVVMIVGVVLLGTR